MIRVLQIVDLTPPKKLDSQKNKKKIIWEKCMVLVLLSASVKRFSFPRRQDFCLLMMEAWICLERVKKKSFTPEKVKSIMWEVKIYLLNIGPPPTPHSLNWNVLNCNALHSVHQGGGRGGTDQANLNIVLYLLILFCNGIFQATLQNKIFIFMKICPPTRQIKKGKISRFW